MATKAKFAVGNTIVFNGYKEEVPEEEQLLTEGEQYEVVEVNAAEKSLAVQIDNPDFNPKKKESESNPKSIIVDVFNDEVSLAEDAEEEEAPAPVRGKKPAVTAKPAAKTKAAPAEDEAGEDEDGEAEEEEAPAPKGKAVAKPAAKAATKPAAKGKVVAKGKAVAKPKAKKEEKKDEDEDELPALENEDEDILALVNEADDILELASELVEEGAALDYKLGGVLYHVRLGKAYQELDEAYKERGGFGLYVKDKLNIEYRKAMYLIDIYYKFNQFGIDAAKVQELGWTKCSKIAAVMTEDNAEELVELADKSSVSELNDAIKESYKEVGGTKGEKRRKVAFKFRLWEDQAAAVEEIIKGTAQQLGFKDLSDAFEHIVVEWAAEHPLTKSTKKAAVAAAPAAKAGKRVAAKA